MEPTPGQLQALKAIVCHVLAEHYREVIAYGAGWSDQERQQPVGDTGRHEPRHPDAILDAELQAALEDPDPLRGIAQLTARWAAAFVLDPDGIPRTKALGSERMSRKLRDALPGGSGALRAAVWEFARPMLSPALAAMHRDASSSATRPPRPPCVWPTTAATATSRTSDSTTPPPDPTPSVLPPLPLTGPGAGGAPRSGRASLFLPSFRSARPRGRSSTAVAHAKKETKGPAGRGAVDRTEHRAQADLEAAGPRPAQLLLCSRERERVKLLLRRCSSSAASVWGGVAGATSFVWLRHRCPPHARPRWMPSSLWG